MKKSRFIIIIFALLFGILALTACASAEAGVTEPVVVATPEPTPTPTPDPCADCRACDCGDEYCCVPENCSDCEMLGTYWITDTNLRAERLSFPPAQRRIYDKMCAECQDLFRDEVEELRAYLLGTIDRRISSIAEAQGLSAAEAVVYWEAMVAETWYELVAWYNQKMLDEGFYCTSGSVPGWMPFDNIIWFDGVNLAGRELAIDIRNDGRLLAHDSWGAPFLGLLSVIANYSDVLGEIIDSLNWDYGAFYDKIESILGYEFPHYRCREFRR